MHGLMAGHLSGSAFCNFHMLEVPEQESRTPLGVWDCLRTEDKPSELSHSEHAIAHVHVHCVLCRDTSN